MKLVLLITITLVGCSYQLDLEKMTKDFEDTIDREARDCYAENKLTREILDKNIKDPKIFETEQYRCFYHCVILHLNIFDDKENIVEDKFKYYLKGEPELRHKVYEACKNVHEPKVCGKVAGLSQCIGDVMKKELGL